MPVFSFGMLKLNFVFYFAGKYGESIYSGKFPGKIRDVLSSPFHLIFLFLIWLEHIIMRRNYNAIIIWRPKETALYIISAKLRYRNSDVS